MALILLAGGAEFGGQMAAADRQAIALSNTLLYRFRDYRYAGVRAPNLPTGKRPIRDQTRQGAQINQWAQWDIFAEAVDRIETIILYQTFFTTLRGKSSLNAGYYPPLEWHR